MLRTVRPPPFPDSYNTVETVCLLIERMMVMILQRMKTKNDDYELTAVMNIN